MIDNDGPPDVSPKSFIASIVSAEITNKFCFAAASFATFSLAYRLALRQSERFSSTWLFMLRKRKPILTLVNPHLAYC